MHRRHLLAFALAGATLPLPLLARASQTVLAARGWHDGDKLRLVFDLSGEVKYDSFELTAPDRLILDLHGTQVRAQLNDRSLLAGPLKAIRSSVRPNGDTRLVLEFSEKVSSHAFLIPPAADKGHRLVLDLVSGTARLAAAGTTTVVQQAKADPPPAPEPVPLPHGNKPGRDIIVVVDAGHGGKDPGALGSRGEQEKHVALAIAQNLAARINRQKGYKARLVRNDDVFIPLRKRAEYARKFNADMFISVHADAAPRLTASGASVFALSDHGATSTMARWMADKENSADLIGSRQLLSLKDKDPMLADVILDMSMNATISASLDLGKHVLDSVGNVAGTHGKRVEQAGFAVLKSPDIPSILVETGFISNANDARKLVDVRHQQKVADAILAGIGNYFERNPPAGTMLAQRLAGTTATV